MPALVNELVIEKHSQAPANRVNACTVVCCYLCVVVALVVMVLISMDSACDVARS